MNGPATPSRRLTANNEEFNDYVLEISRKWDLQLNPPTTADSPSRRISRSTTEAQKIGQACVGQLSFLFWKSKPLWRNALEVPIKKFNKAARREVDHWPERSLNGITAAAIVSPDQEQRLKLLYLLKNELDPEVAKLKSTQIGKTTNGETSRRELFQDMPPIPIPKLAKPKRAPDEFVEPNSASKKSKRGAEQAILGRIDEVPVTTRKAVNGNSNRLEQTSFPNYGAIKPRRESTLFSSTDSVASTVLSDLSSKGSRVPESANTSFASDSVKGSHYSRTIQTIQPTSKLPAPTFSQSFSQLDDEIDPDDFATLLKSTPFSAAATIRERLQGVFPILPKCLEKAPFGIRYEVSRIFLHAKVSPASLDEVQLPQFSDLENYEKLWQWLKSLPALSGKRFPDRSESAAWEMALGTFKAGFKRVRMSGVLDINDSAEGPLFGFRLHPLSTELTFRLGRRFGHDRFIEISTPLVDDLRKLPKNVAQLMQSAGESGRQQIIEWLHQDVHEFLGRTWGAFYVKDRSRKNKSIAIDEDVDKLTTKRVCFFATSGIDFSKSKAKAVSPKDEPVDRHSEMTVRDMLNWLLSLDKNGGQNFLKFYSRISLGLSTTFPTVILAIDQIKKKKKDILSTTGEVMNDGCGRISFKLAQNVSDILGVSPPPSAFQGRIGEAKGLWIVDYISEGTYDQVWLETYPSQRKWERTNAHFGFSSESDEEHRTFEVLDWATRLKSASLTLQFLPLLEDRGVPRAAISQLLVNGLTHETGQMIAAIQNPLSFRKWLHEHSPSVSRRLKTGYVEFKGGRPDTSEETLNMLLDAGFDPKKLGYARDIARQSLRTYCERLKEKLSIRVGLSLYAYIAVDWAGILAPDEIHLSFSTPFQDEMSGRTLHELDGMDVLIARSPAHFVSDIRKVRAVFKPELRKYKDVVILPTTGEFPLAGLLSGGDYDGDTVWLGFDPEIVEHFQNSEIPKQPDLLLSQNGEAPFVRKDATKFSEVMAGGPRPFQDFLQKSFAFNFKMSYLGICTKYKDKECYEQNSVSSKVAVYLSTLLSSLVDQSKQGFVFNEEDWKRFQLFLSKIRQNEEKRPTMRRGMRKHQGLYMEHVTDYLKHVANQHTENALKEYHELLNGAKYFDEDLIKCAEEFRYVARSSPPHKAVLLALEEELEKLKKKWSSLFGRDKTQDESKPAFKKTLTTVFDQWQDILPVGEDWLKESLLQKSWCSKDHSHWMLLKTSLLFQTYLKGKFKSTGFEMSSFPWWMACRQLCQLKAMTASNFNSLTPPMFAMLRPDSAFVKMIQSEKYDPKFQEAKGEVEFLEDENDYDMDLDDENFIEVD